MIPRMFLEGIQGSDVVRRDPAHVAGIGVRFAPFAGFVVGEDADLFALAETKLVLATCLKVV